jgi:predicted SprT family Zn-dependent metalloprotease
MWEPNPTEPSSNLSVYIEYYTYSCMTNERELREKIDEQREESPYKCSICDRAFSDRAEFERHQNSMHREQQSI